MTETINDINETVEVEESGPVVSIETANADLKRFLKKIGLKKIDQKARDLLIENMQEGKVKIDDAGSISVYSLALEDWIKFKGFIPPSVMTPFGISGRNTIVAQSEALGNATNKDKDVFRDKIFPHEFKLCGEILTVFFGGSGTPE